MLAGLSCALLLATCAMPWVARMVWLSGPMVFLWGGIGGALYTLCITDIGAREKGITLVNSTAVLVLTYTLGGLVASAMCGALIDWSPRLALPAALLLVAGVSCVAPRSTRRSVDTLTPRRSANSPAMSPVSAPISKVVTTTTLIGMGLA